MNHQSIPAQDVKVHFPSVHVICMIITTIIFLGFLFKPLNDFRSLDKGPRIIPADGEKIAAMQASKQLVDTHFLIYDSPRFNPEKNSWRFKGAVSFTYYPSAISREIIEKFDIYKGSLEKSAPTFMQNADGSESAHFAIDGTCAMQIDYKDYPLDDHRFVCAFYNRAAKPTNLLYAATQSDNFFVEEHFAMNWWREREKVIEQGFIAETFPHQEFIFPAISFAIDYTHVAVRQTAIILLPLFLIFFLCTFVLSLNPSRYHSTMVNTAAAGIWALIGYLFVLVTISPHVGYFMLSDYLFFLFFTTVFFNFLIAMFVEQISLTTLKFLIIGLYTWIVVATGYLLLIWL